MGESSAKVVPTESLERENQWVIAIKNELQDLTSVRVKKVKSGKGSTIFRVRGQVRKVKADHFDAELLFLGLFHKNQHKVLDVNKDRGEKFKLEMTSAFLKLVNKDYTWDQLCEEVVDDPRRMLEHYHVEDPDYKLVQCSLTLDAIFLTSYLLGYLFLQDPDDATQQRFPFSLESFREIVSEEGLSFHNIVANDITKLENQIPLSLIGKVLDILYRNKPPQCRPAEDLLNEMCYKVVKTISLTIPGFCDDVTLSAVSRSKVVNFRKADHLLGCICSVMRGATVNPRVKEPAYESVSPEPERCWVSRQIHRLVCTRQLWQSWVAPLCEAVHQALPSARAKQATRSFSDIDEQTMQKISIASVTKLYEAGVEFRGETRGNSNIDLVPRFKRKFLKAYLYIPTFSILHRTEQLWRNMVAYESETVRLGDHGVSQFIYFLKFMDELINTETDVSLLRRGRHPVIPKNMLGTEKDVAELFNKIAQHYTVVDARAPQWLELRSEIDAFFKRRYRKMVLEFLRYNFGKPWFVISIFAATILLVLTFLQTIYTLLAFYP